MRSLFLPFYFLSVYFILLLLFFCFICPAILHLGPGEGAPVPAPGPRIVQRDRPVIVVRLCTLIAGGPTIVTDSKKDPSQHGISSLQFTTNLQRRARLHANI